MEEGGPLARARARSLSRLLLDPDVLADNTDFLGRRVPTRVSSVLGFPLAGWLAGRLADVAGGFLLPAVMLPVDRSYFFDDQSLSTGDAEYDDPIEIFR